MRNRNMSDIVTTMNKILLSIGAVLSTLYGDILSAHHDEFKFHIDCKFTKRITQSGESEVKDAQFINIYKSNILPSDPSFFTETMRKRPGFRELAGKKGSRLFVFAGVTSLDPDSLLVIYRDKNAVRTIIQRNSVSSSVLTELGVCEIFE